MATDNNNIMSGDESKSSSIRLHRRRTVFPSRPSPREQIKLTALDIQLLYAHYIQRGLLFKAPIPDFSATADRLATSLSHLLVHFYPLAGRFTPPSPHGMSIDCNDAGAEFIEASSDLTIAALTTPEVTSAVEALYPLEGAANVEGHRLPLLAIQITKLRDGISVGCTLNHGVADGTSFWHFFNSWAEICRGNNDKIPVDPVHDRCLIGGGITGRLNIDPDDDIPRLCPPPLRVKMFHFSKEAVRGLKEAANRDSPVQISSFQALSGHVWRAITRARGLGPDVATTLRVSVNCRGRLVPPLPGSYFGNCIQLTSATVTAGELVGNDLYFAARLLHDAIEAHGDSVIRKKIAELESVPVPVRLDKYDSGCLQIGSSPRFGMYDNDFGWGEPVAVRSGIANHFDGKLSAYPGKEGGGSVDLEICLRPPFMACLEMDQDFVCPLIP